MNNSNNTTAVCPNCQTIAEEGNRFCIACGTPVSVVPQGGNPNPFAQAPVDLFPTEAKEIPSVNIIPNVPSVFEQEGFNVPETAFGDGSQGGKRIQSDPFAPSTEGGKRAQGDPFAVATEGGKRAQGDPFAVATEGGKRAQEDPFAVATEGGKRAQETPFVSAPQQPQETPFVSAPQPQETPFASAQQPQETPFASAQPVQSAESSISREEMESRPLFANGLADWDIVPPEIMVRRKRKS